MIFRSVQNSTPRIMTGWGRFFLVNPAIEQPSQREEQIAEIQSQVASFGQRSERAGRIHRAR